MICFPASLPLRIRAAAVLCGALSLGACCNPTGALPHGGAPAALEFSISGYGSTQRALELRGDTVVVRRAPWSWNGPPQVDSVRVVPGPEAWEAFWDATERAGVTRWRSRYVAENIADGTGWGLRLRAGGREIRSQGSNAYPDRHGREHEGEMTDDFSGFVAALDALIGEPF